MNVPQTRPLFRQEVIEFQQHTRQWGRVVPIQPLSIRATFWLIAVSLVAIFIFLFTGSYARKEIVTGYLAPASGTARVFPSREGVVRAIHVAQGQVVTEGEPLFTIVVPQIAANGSDVNGTILASLTQQREALAQQISGEQTRAASERELLTGKIADLKTELEQVTVRIALQRARIVLAQQLVTAAKKLAPRGLISNVELHQREESVLQQLLTLNDMLGKQTAEQGELNEAQYNLKVLPVVTQGKVQALRNTLAETVQRIAEVNGRQSYEVRAPISGRIAMLQASVGAVADPKQLLAQIIPGSSPLQAEVFIPPGAIGFVRAGQEVRIHYDAFPYQNFGAYHGHIVSVSQTLVTPHEVAGPLSLRDPAYRAVVSLTRPDIDAYGKRVALQPDMLLHAYVILDRQKLLDWLLNPLRSARG